MRIATYNVNGVNARLPNLLAWLEETSPEVVCLQELKAPEDKFPIAANRAVGYGAIWHGQKSWNGVAILARGADPVETHRGLPGGEADILACRQRRVAPAEEMAATLTNERLMELLDASAECDFKD